MPTRLSCPDCDAEFRQKDIPIGKAVRCPDCDRKFFPEDEDDRPRRSRRDDGEDDRPARKQSKRASGKNKRKKTNPLVFIIPAAGVFLLAIVGVVLYVTVIRGTKSDSPDGRGRKKIDNELLAQLPEGTSDVHYVELETIYRHPKLPEVIRRDIGRAQQRELHGIPPEDVSVFATGRGSPGKGTLVLKLQRANRSSNPD